MKKILTLMLVGLMVLISVSCGTEPNGSSSSTSSTSLPAQRFTIRYYTTSWVAVNMHFQVGTKWTTAPGLAMSNSGSGWWTFVTNLPDEEKLTFVFNNGTDWDNNSGNNYTTYSNETWIMNGNLFYENPFEKKYTLTIHYKNPAFTTPAMWFWEKDKSGIEITASGSDAYGSIFTITTNGGFNYGFKFKQGATYEPDGIDRYTGNLASDGEYWFYGESKAFFTSDPTSLVQTPPDATYTNKIGATIVGGGQVNFVLFAPKSRSVSVKINNGTPVAMNLTPDGKLWYVRTAANALDTYSFVLNGTTTVADPYARANQYSGTTSIIIDPTAFTFDSGFVRPDIRDIVIYECHINDMTYNDASVPAAIRGKFLGMTNKIPYLKALGVNAIEIMPMQEFPGSWYSWGYNNSLYFAPESDYATANNGVQAAEFKTMINEFQKAGIAVLLDVVYNHTANSDNHLWTIDDEYYFNPLGTPWGNKLYVERPMVKRFVYDNLKYWMEEYNIDGFRFDGVWEIDRPSLWSVISDLKTAGFTSQYYIAELFGDGYFKNKGVPTWSSTYRDSAKNFLKYTPTKVGGGGNGGYYGVGATIYFANDTGYFGGPHEALNYIESHDEATMGHFLGSSATGTNAGLLGLSVLMTSLGVPMIYEGQEFYRDKGEQVLTDVSNRLQWGWTNTSTTNFFNYAAGLIKLRTTYRAFRAEIASFGNWATVDWESTLLSYYRTNDGTNFLICLNVGNSVANRTITDFPVDGEWKLIANMVNVDTNGVGASLTVSGNSSAVSIPARSLYIYMYPY